MRRVFFLLLLILPETLHAAENLIMDLQVIHNCTLTDNIVHQIDPDTRIDMQWKLLAFYNNNRHNAYDDTHSWEHLWSFYDNTIGFISYTFTTPDDLEDLAYFRFGLNGSKIDTSIKFDIKNVMPNTTYTLQWRVLNNTQGTVAWTDMFLTQCGGGYTLALGDTNCSRTCDNQLVDGGYIPPDSMRVDEPGLCTYTPDHLVCNDGYGRVGDTCEQMCRAGITHLRVGTTVHNLYARKTGTPSLCVQYNGHVCYGRLSRGDGTGININIDGMVYHLID